MREQHLKDMRNHIISERESRCIRFADPSNNNLSFQILWSRGCIQIFGDIGELTFIHYSAFDNFDSAMNWLSGESTNYQFSKSNSVDVVDRDATILNMEFELSEYEKNNKFDGEWDSDENEKEYTNLSDKIEYIKLTEYTDAGFVNEIYQDYPFGESPISYKPKERDLYILKCARMAAKQYLGGESNEN